MGTGEWIRAPRSPPRPLAAEERSVTPLSPIKGELKLLSEEPEFKGNDSPVGRVPSSDDAGEEEAPPEIEAPSGLAEGSCDPEAWLLLAAALSEAAAAKLGWARELGLKVRATPAPVRGMVPADEMCDAA